MSALDALWLLIWALVLAGIASLVWQFFRK